MALTNLGGVWILVGLFGWFGWRRTVLGAIAAAVGHFATVGWLMATGGFSLWRLASVLCLGGGITWLYRLARPDESEGVKTIVELVVLLRTARIWDGPELAAVAGEVFGGPFAVNPDREGGKYPDRYLFGGDGAYAIFQGDAFMKLVAMPQPYFTAKIQDPDGQKLLDAHQGAFTLGLLGPNESYATPAALTVLGRLLTRLAENNAVAVYLPAMTKLVLWNEGVKGMLAGDDPLKVFCAGFSPLIITKADDPRMEAAKAEARSRWPEFEAAWKQKGASDHFFVKAPVTGGGNTEFIWLEVEEWNGDQIKGRLDNKPFDLGELKEDDRVEVKVADVTDWFFDKGGQFTGPFSVEALHPDLPSE